MKDIGAEAGALRYGLSYLWPSEIAEQFYCEYKVHLKQTHPEVRVQLPVLELGEAGHVALVTEAEPVTPEDVESSIQEGKKLAICEWVLEALVQGVRIRGRPDFLAFEGKKALLLLDFKFSSAKEPFRDQEVQADVYALLTEGVGFSTGELCFGIVLFPPPGFSGRHTLLAKAEELQFLNASGTLHEVYERCDRERAELLGVRARRRVIEGDGWKGFLYQYDRKKAEKDLAWALGFWRGVRDPIPVRRRPRKCFACPFNAVGLCEHALQQPDPSFKVQRRSDGRVFVHR